MKRRIIEFKLLVLLLLFISGCERYHYDDFEVRTKSLFTVDDAQAWYGSENVSYPTMKSGSLFKTIGIKPDWCNSVESRNDQADIVEVGLLTQGSFGFADEKSAQDWNDRKDPASIGSLTRMVFLRNRTDGKTINFLMTIVGDNSYHQNVESKIGKNFYLTKEKHFSGMFSFITWMEAL